MSNVISIIRDRFNPASFVEPGWTIVMDERDELSVALTELDLNKVHLVTMLRERERSIKGEEKLERLKASSKIRLDADVFLTFWENKDLIPESWKEKVEGYTQHIHFDGTVLRNSYGNRYTLCLFWYDYEGEDEWFWSVQCLSDPTNVETPSAVLELGQAA